MESLASHIALPYREGIGDSSRQVQVILAPPSRQVVFQGGLPIFKNKPNGDHAQNADRYVDVENPGPLVIIRDPTAQNWPDNRRCDHNGAPKSKRCIFLFRRRVHDQ